MPFKFEVSRKCPTLNVQHPTLNEEDQTERRLIRDNQKTKGLS
jgi:hypothetical protein